jgi:mannose-6-phosphate isomerase-like protein (cupin superfamily)
MLPTLVKLESHAQLPVEKEEVGVEKFIFCLKGEIEVTISKNPYRIKKDDSIYFDASLPHILSNPTAKEAEAFSITSPPKI